MKIKCHHCNAISINGKPVHETGCLGSFIFTKGKFQFQMFDVWSLDVWGNLREGFEVNDRSKLGIIMIEENDSDKKIIQRLKTANYLHKFSKDKSFLVDGDELRFDIEFKNKPVLQLEVR